MTTFKVGDLVKDLIDSTVGKINKIKELQVNNGVIEYCIIGNKSVSSINHHLIYFNIQDLNINDRVDTNKISGRIKEIDISTNTIKVRLLNSAKTEWITLESIEVHHKKIQSNCSGDCDCNTKCNDCPDSTEEHDGMIQNADGTWGWGFI